MKASLVTQPLKPSLVCYLLKKFNLKLAFIFVYTKEFHM